MVAGAGREMALKGAHELAPCKVKVTREGVRHRVGRPCKVVVSRDVAVEFLVDAKQAQTVRRDLIRCGAPCSLPEKGVEVISLAEDRALRDVEILDMSFNVE